MLIRARNVASGKDPSGVLLVLGCQRAMTGLKVAELGNHGNYDPAAQYWARTLLGPGEGGRAQGREGRGWDSSQLGHGFYSHTSASKQ